MSCVRNFVLSILCLLASGQCTYGLRISLQNLDVGVSRSDLYTRQSSSANAGVPSQNLTIPPNPFVFESATGYTAIYEYTGKSSISRPRALRLIAAAMEALEHERKAEGGLITSPIPERCFQARQNGEGFELVWGIGQEGVRITEILSYQHAEIALQGTQEVVREYDIVLARQYRFTLFRTRSMKLVAHGYLIRVPNAVTI